MDGKNLVIRCEARRAIPYKDLLDLYLIYSRVKRWNRIDDHGIDLPRQAMPKILSNLFRDLLMWPFTYLKISKILNKANKWACGKGMFQKGNSLVFLRTDHWFNVQGGGSVGHLSGVVHGFRAIGYETHVVSTDRLVGIKNDAYFHLWHPVYELGRNLPNMPEFLYNDQFISYMDRNWADWSPSFIYQRYSLGNYAGVFLKRKYGIPFVCEYNGSFSWVARPRGKRKLFHEKLIYRIELLNLNTADVVVVVSQPIKDELVKQGINAEKILVNPNGVDPEVYSPRVDGSAVRSQYKLDGRVVIGFTGYRWEMAWGRSPGGSLWPSPSRLPSISGVGSAFHDRGWTHYATGQREPC